jgi:DNA-damage-inducible protein D
MNKKEGLVLFGGKEIRRTFIEGNWFFSVVDIVGALTDSINPRDYWYRLKVREEESSKVQLSTFCRQLKIKSEDGKEYFTDCADTESLLRIIQSIPSKKAEPFKRWLAKVGYERIKEIEDPELAQERMKDIYEKKGYSKSWIDKRLRGIAIRQNLTDEWKERDVGEEIEYSILTNEIAKATFGVSIGEHKNLKDLDKQNLRDHMNELELIFGMLGEKVATEITISKDAQGFNECSVAAKRGGRVAGNARREAEAEIGASIVSESNYLQKSEKKNNFKKKILIKPKKLNKNKKSN